MARKTIPEEERQLFRQAVADAKPLAFDRVRHQPELPPAIPLQRQRDESSALHESLHGPVLLDLHLEGGDEAAWLRTGLDRNILRDLRRGRWVVKENLDLHGCNRDQARAMVAGFIAMCVKRHVRCVRIVHGKGLGSPGREPVLKKLVLGWLAQKKEVLAFCQAAPVDGGGGAVLVLLSR